MPAWPPQATLDESLQVLGSFDVRIDRVSSSVSILVGLGRRSSVCLAPKAIGGDLDPPIYGWCLGGRNMSDSIAAATSAGGFFFTR